MQKILLITSMLFLVWGCSCNCGFNEDKLQETAFQKYGGSFKILLNEENTFALVINKSKPTPNNPNISINFFLFDLNDNIILYERNNYAGNVSWINNSQIEMRSIPGIVQYDQDQSSDVIIYDLILEKEIRN